MSPSSSSKPGTTSSWPGPSGPTPPRGRQTARGKIIAVLGIVLLGLLVWWAGHKPGKDKSAANQAVPVVVAAARLGTFVAYQSEPGTVTPANSVVVRSRVDGELLRVTFTGGQMVKQGDLLAEIDARPFQAQLQQATGDLAHSQALLANAQDTLKHYQVLLAQNSIARQRVSDQQSQVSQYAAEVKSNQGRIDTARLQLANSRITAPISGMVGLRRVDPGNMVGPSDARGIAVVTQSQPSKVVFAVPVGAVPHVLERLHSGSCIPVQAYGDGADEVLASGHLLAANNEVDPATGTVKFEAEFANAAGTLLPNQFVTAKLPVDIIPRAVLVPAAAIQHGASGTFVYAVAKDGTAAVVPVKVGPSDAASAVIEQGITPGTQVVIEGADRLRAGIPVNATVSAVATEAAASTPLECRQDEGDGPHSAPLHLGASGAAAGHHSRDPSARS